MVLNMKFKVRLVMFTILTLILLMTFFMHMPDSSLTSVGKGRNSNYLLSKLSGFFSSEGTEQCTGTVLVNVTADIKTLNIWDQVEPISEGIKYKVMFPQEEVPKPVKTGHTPEPLTVLIIPHSHNDPGWLRTLDEYFTESTKKIFDLMLQKLATHPDMRMVWAETVFLALWHEQASVESRISLKKLVDSGQLDIVTGGWVMPDEASTHYYSIIDQLIEGHQWLLKTLGVKPRINWSIDPFGHSGTVPYLWRLAHFDAMVIQRIHQAMKDYLGHYKKLQFNWRQNWDNKGRHDILCHVMPYLSYDSTATCGPDDLVCRKYVFRHQTLQAMTGDPKSESYNTRLEAYVTPLYKQYRLKAENFQHNVIFVPLGGDFHWDTPKEWDDKYFGYTTMMAYMNSRSDWNIQVRFGTLTEYFNLLKLATPPVRYPSLTGDFYVYSEIPGQFWSGYFTSRPLDKFLGREIQSLLKAVDILHNLAAIHTETQENAYSYQNCYKLLETSRRSLALYQHHDAITGTAKPFVVRDYEDRLSTAFTDLQSVFKEAVLSLLGGGSDQAHILLNVKSTADAFDTFSRRFQYQVRPSGTKLVVFNPSTFGRTELISLMIDKGQILVTEPSGSNRIIPHQISPIWSPQGDIMDRNFELSFYVDMSPWSLTTYSLTPRPSSTPLQDPALAKIFMTLPNGQQHVQQQGYFKTHPIESSKDIVLENACLRVSIASSSGMIKEILHKNTNVVTSVGMELVSYIPGAMSGAYLFRPMKDDPRILSTDGTVKVTHIQGPLYSAVRAVHPLYQTTIKLHNSWKDQLPCWAVYIDNMATLGASSGDELVMRFRTDVQNKDVLYTDGNGLDMVKHRRFPKLPMPAAYYPMTSTATIQDDHKRLTIQSAQPHGAASLKPGSIEIMLERSVFSDDGKGLGEGIRRNKPVPSKFLLYIEPKVGPVKDHTGYFHQTLQSWRLSDMLQNPLHHLSYDQPLDLITAYDPSLFKIPCDANVISFRPLGADSETKGFRTALILEKRGHECGTLPETLHCNSNWKTLSFSKLLGVASPSSVREMSLSLTDVIRDLSLHDDLDLQAMDIKSFSVNWNVK